MAPVVSDFDHLGAQHRQQRQRDAARPGAAGSFTLNATSSDGEYFPCSIAMTVCRVTPMRSARSACVISPASNRPRLSTGHSTPI